MDMKPGHWVGLLIIAGIAYYAGMKGWLGGLTAKIPGA